MYWVEAWKNKPKEIVRIFYALLVPSRLENNPVNRGSRNYLNQMPRPRSAPSGPPTHLPIPMPLPPPPPTWLPFPFLRAYLLFPVGSLDPISKSICQNTISFHSINLGILNHQSARYRIQQQRVFHNSCPISLHNIYELIGTECSTT